MGNISEIETERLLLRQWDEEDLSKFAQINLDPDVMEFFPDTLSRKESYKLADKLKGIIEENGWGFWAIELKSTHDFIGVAGLNIPQIELPVKPLVEIGWRFARKHWGKGYATEAAKASIDYGFCNLNLDNIYSFTSVLNKRSIRVMERLGMENMERNFAHPLLPPDSPLSEHVLYRIKRVD